jgi:hypothetical protein
MPPLTLKGVEMNELNETRKRLHQAMGTSAYHLELFGDHLAQKNSYDGLDGIEAIHYYLVQKHSWLPRDVRSMSYEDLRFLLNKEMAGWTIPASAK